MKKYFSFGLLSLILLIGFMSQFSYAKTIIDTIDNETQTISKANNVKDTSSLLSSKVVIYNTHTLVKYTFGESIVDISKKMRDKFLEKGVDCIYLENNVDATKHDYNDLFNVSRELIISNIPDYKECVLLDMDVMLGNDNNTGFEFRGSLSEYNKRFLDKMVLNYNPILFEIPGKKLNQDLSNKQLYMVMGKQTTSKDDVYNNMNSLVNAITITNRVEANN